MIVIVCRVDGRAWLKMVEAYKYGLCSRSEPMVVEGP